MQRRLGTSRQRASARPAGNLWLRSDLRRVPEPPVSRLVVLRKPLTWILTAVLLLTTAAAGQAYLAGEPSATPAQTALPAPAPQQSFSAPPPPHTLQQLGATQEALAAEIQQLRETNRGLLNRLETLQAAILPEEIAGQSY